MEVGGKIMEKGGESTTTFLYLCQFNSVAYLFTMFPLLFHGKFV